MTWNHWLMNPLLTGVFFELGLALFYQFVASAVGQRHGRQTGLRVDYDNQLLQLFTILYFSSLGVYFEYCAWLYQSDLAFINFRILLVSFLIFFSGAGNNVIVITIMSVARLFFRGLTTDSLVILGLMLTIFAILQFMQRYLLRSERSGLAIMPSVVAVLAWSFLHMYFKTSWFYVSRRLLSFFVMAIILYVTVIILNRDNRQLSALSRSASYDALTSVKNYHTFSVEFERQLQTARAAKKSLTLVALDIDHFKQINDSYGHLAGNAALFHLASQLKDFLQTQDPSLELYRVGGEEFNIVGLGYEADELAELMFKYQKVVQREPVHYHNQKIWLTISAGVTELNANDQTVPMIYERADRNLYLSKGRGRNQITVDGRTL